MTPPPHTHTHILFMSQRPGFSILISDVISGYLKIISGYLKKKKKKAFPVTASLSLSGPVLIIAQ